VSHPRCTARIIKIGRAKSNTSCVWLRSTYLYDCMQHNGYGSLKSYQCQSRPHPKVWEPKEEAI